MPNQRKILIWENSDGNERIAIERGLICALGKYLNFTQDGWILCFSHPGYHRVACVNSSVRWIAACNRLFILLDRSNTPTYRSGPNFLRMVQQVDPGSPSYEQLMPLRNQQGKRTSRKSCRLPPAACGLPSLSGATS